MTKPNHPKYYILLILLLANFIALNGLYTPDKYKNAPIMHLEDLEIGMKGVGYTVFTGMEVEEFSVEILGVLTNKREIGSYILAKMDCEKLQSTGVIAGMSGSPVYINGKLVGAVCATYPFTKEPIGFIRPIESMLNVLNKKTNVDKRSNPVFIPLDKDLAMTSYKNNPEAFSNTYTAFKNTLGTTEKINSSTIVPVKNTFIYFWN